MHVRLLALVLLASLLPASAAAQAETAPGATATPPPAASPAPAAPPLEPAALEPAVAELRPGVHLLRGRFVPDRQPDGNTVILAGASGLVVVDTGRHLAHTQAIADFARAAGRPIEAIVNTHWHLDHVGGNVLLRREYPAARVHATEAIDGALAGFLARYREHLQGQLAATVEADARARIRAELALIEAGPALRPDAPVTMPEERTLAGRRVRLEVESAATAGDLWLLDVESGVLVAGDLVTLPVPFLDTACPARWQAALRRLAAARWEVLVPGHGPPMSRADLGTYRTAFDNLLACADSKAENAACAAAWLRDLGPLLPPAEHAFALRLLDYYLREHLRSPGATAHFCR